MAFTPKKIYSSNTPGQAPSSGTELAQHFNDNFDAVKSDLDEKDKKIVQLEQNELSISTLYKSSLDNNYGEIYREVSTLNFSLTGAYLSSSGVFAETISYRSTPYYPVNIGDIIIINNTDCSDAACNIIVKNSNTVNISQSVRGQTGGIQYIVPVGVTHIAFSCSIEQVSIVNICIYRDNTNNAYGNTIGLKSKRLNSDFFIKNGCVLKTGIFAETDHYKSTGKIAVSKGDVIKFSNISGSDSVFILSVYYDGDMDASIKDSVIGKNNIISDTMNIESDCYIVFTCDIENYINTEIVIESANLTDTINKLQQYTNATILIDKANAGNRFIKQGYWRVDTGGFDSTSTHYVTSPKIVVQSGQVFEYKLYGNDTAYVIAAYDNDRNIVINKLCSVVGKGPYTPSIGVFTVPYGIKYIEFTTISQTDYLNMSCYNPIRQNNLDISTRIVANMSHMSFSDTATTNPDGSKTIHNEGIGYGGQINCRSVEYFFKISTKIRISASNLNGNFWFVVGKSEPDAGTLLGLKKEGNDYYIQVYCTSGLNTLQTRYSKKIRFIPMNRDIRIEIIKRRDYCVFNVISECKSINEFIEIFGENIGSCWGYPIHYSVQGKYTMYDFFFSVQANDKPRLVIFGDSYTEGSTLRFTKENLYSELLAKEIGRLNVVNLGKGGETSERIKTRFEKQVDWFSGAEYVMLNYGVNDGNNIEEFKANLTEQIAYVKSKGIKPILCTIPLRYDKANKVNIDVLNPWIKSHSELMIDMYAALVDVNGNVPADVMLLDNIHPTIKGHRQIYNRIKLDAPYLF